MKKIGITFGLVAVSLSLFGCVNENKDNVTTKVDSEKILESTSFTGTFENIMGYSGEYFF